MKKLKIATRMSQLALWQAEHLKSKLLALYPDLEIELVPIKTQGDKLLSVSLSKIGGKGLFVKELEEALLKGEADMAVHSIKDMPAELPLELKLAVYCSRETPNDVLISRVGQKLEALKPNPIIGTSSLRRQAQLKALRSDCECVLLRGNVPTRVEKLFKGEYDAIVLALAGLTRLNLTQHITQVFSIEQMLPAVGQGALGVECRSNDTELLTLLAPLNEPKVEACVVAERVLNARLGGSCQIPIAGYATLNEESPAQITLIGRVANVEGTVILEGRAQGLMTSAADIGEQVANQLVEQGARHIIEAILC